MSRTLRLTLVALLASACLLPAQVERPSTKKPRVDLYGDPLPEGAVARMGSRRLRHHTMYASLDAAFSPDGKRIVTGGSESLRFWDRATGKLLAEVTEDYRQARMVFSPDGKWLAVPSRGAVCIRDGHTGRLIRRIDGPEYAFAVSPDGTLLAAGIDRNAVGLWNTATGKGVARLEEHKEPVGDAAFSRDGRTLVTMCVGKRLCRWQVPGGKLEKSLEVAVPQWRTFSLSPDGQTLAVVPYSREAVQLWDAETGKLRLKLEGDPACSRYGLSFSADGELLATNWSEEGADEGLVSLWDTGNGKPVRRFKVPVRAIHHVVLAPDGKALLSEGHPLVYLWDGITGEPLLEHQGHQSDVNSLDFTPDGQRLLSAAHGDGIRVWDPSTGRQMAQMGQRWDAHTLRALPDCRSCVSAGYDGGIRLWDLSSGKETRRMFVDKEPLEGMQPRYQMTGLRLAGDGHTAVSTTLRHEQGKMHSFAHVWDLATGRELQRRPLPSGIYPHLPEQGPTDVVVSSQVKQFDRDPAHKTPAPTGLISFVVHDVGSGRPILTVTPSNHGTFRHAFAPDGRSLAAVSYREIVRNEEYDHEQPSINVFELVSGHERLTITLPEEGYKHGFQQVRFSAGGRFLISVRLDRVVQVWDCATGKELLRRSGGDSGVRCLALSRDNRLLATGHDEGTILLWPLERETWPWPVAVKLDQQQLESHWSTLAGEDAKKAHAAIWAMVGSPEAAVPFLRARLTPAEGPPPEKLKQWLADLDSPRFATRESAVKELAALEELAHPALEQVLKETSPSPSPEKRKRIEELLNVPRIVRSPETLRRVRAIEVLEHIGTPEAAELLKALAKGAAESRATREAVASLERLARADRQ